jgi:YggT family protein
VAELPAMGVATLGLLADAIDSVQRFVDVFVLVYVLLIFAYILTSWFRMPYSPWLNRIQRFLYDVCEPYLRIFRRFVPQIGPLDLSPMVAVLVLLFAQQLFNALLDSI